MKFIPIGMAAEDAFAAMMDADDFTNENYDGVQLRIRNGKENQPVIIMHSKTTSPRDWKVVYGYSEVFFNTLTEAVAFCEQHGMKLLNRKR